MMCLILFSVLVVFTAARTPKGSLIMPMVDGRIVGGEQTTIEDLPYQISVQLNREHICGGSIISSNKVLTAAHCTDEYRPRSLSVRAGSSKHASGGIVVKVSKICQHPRYDSDTFEYDVSVLKLVSSLTSSRSIQPISLAALGSSVPVGTLGTISGWGRISEYGPVSKVLLKVNVPKVSQKSCKEAYRPFEVTETILPRIHVVVSSN